jgi:hypothetical protein
MFGKLFGRKPAQAETSEPFDPNKAKGELLDHAIEEQRATDPLIGAKIGSKELVERLLDAMRDSKGVHIESLLGTLGSLAGFACVYVTLRHANEHGLDTRQHGIVDVECADGTKYYLGNPINKMLVEGERSIWALAAGMAEHLGVSELPDIREIASHVAGSLGKESFGKPRLPADHKLSDLPVNYVRNVWPAILPLVERFAPGPIEKVVLIGLANQQVMDLGKSAIEPGLALRIVMECAVPMAKLDPSAQFPPSEA